MVFPPGQGRSGPELMALWRRYLEQYAENEGLLEAQILVGACHAAETFGILSRTLDREGRYRGLIDERAAYFIEGSVRASTFEDRLVNAAFALYNHLNTLSQQFSAGSPEAMGLIGQVGDQVLNRTRSAPQPERTALALRASFPLLSLMTLILDQGKTMTDPIRAVEQRFVSGDNRARSDWEHSLNAVYRIVEMMQILAALSDGALQDQAQQIAARFQEEDQTADLRQKLRNGFCRLFELAHLLTTHIDASLS